MSRPALQAEKCDTCIFRPGNPMHLADGRLKDVVDGNQAAGAMLMCHKTTFGQKPREAMCRGYWDAYADSARVVQVMARMFGPEWYEEVPLD